MQGSMISGSCAYGFFIQHWICSLAAKMDDMHQFSGAKCGPPENRPLYQYGRLDGGALLPRIQRGFSSGISGKCRYFRIDQDRC
jgi:hypothetical protein